MLNIQIKTPQNVLISLQLAGLGQRILAFLTDLIIIIIYIFSVTYLFSSFGIKNMITDGLDQDYLTFWSIIYTILMLPAVFYSLWTEWLFNGKTFGKKLFKLKVIKINGYQAGFQEYFTRWIFRYIDFWTGWFLLLFFIPIFGEEIAFILSFLMLYVTGIVAVITISRTKKSQRIGDIIAGTAVVKLNEKHSIDITILEELDIDYKPVYTQAIRLSDNDARIIKDTYQNAVKSNDIMTINNLKLKLEEVLALKTEQTGREFIETVLKDFNYFTQKN